MGRRKLSLCHVEDDDEAQSQENQVVSQSQMNMQSGSLLQSNHPQPHGSSSAINNSMLEVVEDHGLGANNNDRQDTVEEDQQNDQPSPIPGNARSQKRRGRTQLNDIWNLPKKARVVIEVNGAYQPNCKEAGRLNRFIGTMLRKPNTLPLDKWDWRKVPDKDKETCWKIVQSKSYFNSDPAAMEGIKIFVLKKLGSLWRNYKCELKEMHFDITKPSSEIIENAPQNVDLGEFGKLVDFWFSDEEKKRSNTNKDNRGKQNEVYTAGSKSIPQYANEWPTNHTSRATRVNMYSMLRTKKDGPYVSVAAAENVAKMMELQAPQPESTPEEQTKGLFWELDDVYSQVLGPERHGRVRGVGFGPTPSMFGVGKAKGPGNYSTASGSESAKDKQISDLMDRVETLEKVQAMMIIKENSSHPTQVPVSGQCAVDSDSTLESQPMFVVDLS